MFLCGMTRQEVVGLLPHARCVAEIGVAEGAFSRDILAWARPDRLHLIDPWEFQTRADYEHDLYGNAAQAEQDFRFDAVARAFAAEIATGQVVLERSYSADAAARFGEAQFDWVYVDALHSREAVAADLLAYKDKVRPEGFILGHDYTNHLPARTAGFGVVEAVNDFVDAQGYTLLLLTTENFPTYVLTREPEGEPARQFMLRVLHACPQVVEIGDDTARHRFQHHALEIGGRTVVYHSFA